MFSENKLDGVKIGFDQQELKNSNYGLNSTRVSLLKKQHITMSATRAKIEEIESSSKKDQKTKIEKFKKLSASLFEQKQPEEIQSFLDHRE